MSAAELPEDESDQRAAWPGSRWEAQFAALVRVAVLVAGAPASLLSLFDISNPSFKVYAGPARFLDLGCELLFDTHATSRAQVFQVPDASIDPRFTDNPHVRGEPHIRFYAGAPVTLCDGAHVGTLCVLDDKPHRLTSAQCSILSHLAESIGAALDCLRPARVLEDTLPAQAHRADGRQSRFLDPRNVLPSTLAAMQHSSRRYRAEDVLREERQRLACVIEGTHAGTWEWNIQTGETRFNEQWASTLGYTLAQIGPARMSARTERIHPRDLAIHEEMLNRHLLGVVPAYQCEMRMRHLSGRWVWVLSRGRVQTRASNGRPEWMCAVDIEITALKDHEEALRKSQSLLQRTGEIAGIGGWEIDLASGTASLSDQTCRIYGVPNGYRPSIQEVVNFFAPQARPILMAAVERGSAHGKGWDLELPFIRNSGEKIWVRAVGTVEFENEQPVRLIGAFQDITAAVQLRAELSQQHELLRVTLQSIGDAVITTDANGIVTWLNPVAERMTGWSNATARGCHLATVFHIINEESREPAVSPLAACLQEKQATGLATNTILVSRRGEEFGIEDSAAPIRNDDGEILGMVLVFHDVTEQRRLSHEIRYRASHDSLTGLVNRAEFESRLSRLLQSESEDHCSHALMYIDLDQFKLVNDSCGHSVGDKLLHKVSRLLAESVRGRDTLARLGGDEFAIILEHCSIVHAQRVAEQVCERMKALRFTQDDHIFRIGVSIGLVAVDKRWVSAAAVIQAADSACYAAKKGGGNRIQLWLDTDLEICKRNRETEWAIRIEQALSENRFVLHAQRMVPLDHSSVGVHAEVLLRMVDVDGRLVSPSEFLPAAERFQMASRIDRWVLHEAVKWLTRLPDGHSVHILSVNLSGQSIGDTSFHRFAIDVLARAGSPICRQLCLEITETAAVMNMADAACFIDSVRKLGVRVALDDFGAGVSSFGYLKKLAVDFLKIDGQFIRNLLNDPLDQAAVRCFVDVAKVIGVQTIAEFVYRRDVLDEVRRLGIDFAQGFLLHRPVAIDEVLAVPQMNPLSQEESPLCS